MRKFFDRLRSSLTFNIIGGVVVMLLVIGVVISIVSLRSFMKVFKEEYATTTYNMAETAKTYVNANHIDEYLRGEEMDEYKVTLRQLNSYSANMHISLVYVIAVDQSDYGRFKSIFNSVNNRVDDTSYTPWELGFERETTNEEYAQKYRNLYEKKSLVETVFRLKVASTTAHPHITTLVPLKNSAGVVVALMCLQRPISEIYTARRLFFVHFAWISAIAAIIASIAVMFSLKRQFIRPITKVSEEAGRFAHEYTKGKDLATISRFKDISNLGKSIDTMETDMVQFMHDLTKATEEKQRITTELSLANRIQYSMMPHEFPAFPDRSEFDIFATMDPAKEVGGDFYDFFLIDGNHLGLVMADVSGKGVPAALFMMASKIILQSCAMLGGNPSDILTKTNQAVCSQNPEEMFITVWFGILEIDTGILTAANAGHEYPIIKHPDGKFEVLKDKHGFVIGGLPVAKYHEYEVKLEPGSKLFVYTDGLPEATDASGQLFGMDRTVMALNNCCDDTSEHIIRHMRHAVDDFVKEAEQFDDLTMLCLEYKGKK